ncbi:P-loop containing nucleoside triphosphate hydrolase protein [Xylariomycetidae sp. FL0641]|nr:P-loop containing nucleoside triphosphate hydrolase protein [Xylariomycetidae sp. FL0641]
MPSLEPRRRSRARFEEDDDNELSSESESSKRQRRHTDRDDSDPFAGGTSRPPRPKNGRTSINGLTRPSKSLDEFHPGAIVRVLVQNFVTYEHAEFLPGPNLNMVIGPNGTGKSSLVCAICLGLGYSPKHLGRASHVGEFVKHGRDTAIIEVELQKRPNERANHVIRVQINKEDNNRKWWLNGRDSTLKNVQELIARLHIQIDNLCQFLPQDKVAEFAALRPENLFTETLRAAASRQMVNWHQELKELHQDHKQRKEDLDSLSETLKGHENRQQAQQADVDRFREREAIQQKVKDLRDAHAVAEYNYVRAKFKDAKTRKEQASKRLKELEIACGPALEAVNRKREYQERIGPVVDARKKALKEAESAADRVLRAVEAQNERIQQVQGQKDTEEQVLSTKRTSLAKTRKNITDLEARLKNEPPPFRADEWNRKIRAKDDVLEQQEAQKRELYESFEDKRRICNAKGDEIKQTESKLEDLDSQQGQRLAHLNRIRPEAVKGWEWLQDNQDQFEKEVFGPPMLTCSVTDNRYADIIQSLMSQEDFLCFTCQTKNDHKKLSEQFYKHMGFSLTVRTCGTAFESFRSPFPKGRLANMGLEAYAIEYLEGPEPVLAMLCANSKLHVSAVALREITDSQYEQILACEGIPSWATTQTMYRVQRRREYGAGAVATTTGKVRRGQFWSDQPVGDSEKQTLESQKSELGREVDALRADARGIRNKIREIDEAGETVKKELAELRQQKNQLQKASTEYASLPDKIRTQQETLNRTQGELQECRKKLQQYSAEEDQITLEKARSVLQHKDLLGSIRDAYQALLEAQIRLIEAKSDAEGLEERNLDVKTRLDSAKEEISQHKADIEIHRAGASRAKERVQEACHGDEHKLPYLNELAAGKTPEELGVEIEAEQSKLEFIHAPDRAVLEQFKKRAENIESLTRQREQASKKVESLASQMDDLMKKWEPRVDELVSKINDAFGYNFEQINCAGEVGVYKAEDFEEWAIEIKVKFRENETLQQLNQHRQSGGERAVSTIFYLMALQSMAQAPFRVVDEINQGMDPRNERMVHERMVEIACREHTSQYFLITPKLLTGLRYDPRMRVLCIASGEHMPPEGRRLDFNKLVRIQRAIGAAA